MKELFTQNFEIKQQLIVDQFKNCRTAEEKYQKIIELGKQLPPYPPAKKLPEHLVPGCQSLLYLYAELHEGALTFYAHSDALISAGLASLLLTAYNGEIPETLLKCPPQFLEDLGIPSSLSPSRSNGLASLFLKMKQEALKFFLATQKP